MFGFGNKKHWMEQQEQEERKERMYASIESTLTENESLSEAIGLIREGWQPEALERVGNTFDGWKDVRRWVDGNGNRHYTDA